MDALIESIDRAASGRDACELQPTRLACLPDRGDPRLLAALGEGDAGLLELQRRLASRLARLRPKADRDRFHPHLTLARLAPGSPRIDDTPITLPPWVITEIRLMASDLRPTGAVHTPLHICPLQT